MYDYIIAGAGAAGLSLAYRLNHSPLRNKRILIVDKAPKNQNDRTWSFWTDKPMLFEDIVYKQWEQVHFYSPDFSKTYQLNPYSYKTIRGIDFYNHVYQDIATNENIDIVYGSIEHIQDQASGASLQVNDRHYEGQWIFNSLPPSIQTYHSAYHYLKQHFKGWFIETKEAYFDPEVMTFMDFRINQENEIRFFYLLPLTPHQSLVEFTLFSERLLENHVYDQHIKKYIDHFLGIKNYEINEVEQGVIPMADIPLPKKEGQHILNIGTRSGTVKASTGYAFLNIQSQSEQIVQSLLASGVPDYRALARGRTALYDSMLLNVITEDRYPAYKIFANLFKKHSIHKVFRFLDGQSSLWDDLSIISQMPPSPFLKALGHIMSNRLKMKMGR